YEARIQLRRLEEQFERLWANQTEGLEVISLHEAFRRSAIRERSDEDDPDTAPTALLTLSDTPPEIIRLPPRLELRSYQQKAIDAWLASRGRGVLCMATGA